jgi:PEP-CTERM motif
MTSSVQSSFQRPFAWTLSLALLAFSQTSQAHISYGTARNFGTVVAGTNTSIATQTVTSNYGWADASDVSLVFNSTLATTPRLDEAAFVSGTGTDDLYLGDSHKGRAFKLHLDTFLSVTFTASARNASGLTPAFSVYQGLVATSPFTAPQTSADHDYAPASQAWRTTFAQSVAGASYGYLATNGSWNALGNWAAGGDGDPAGVPGALDYLQFVGHGASTVANGVATATLTLGPGDYTVFVGGNDIAAKSVVDSGKAYAFTLGVSAAAVPEPESLALALAGLGMVAVAIRRKQAAAA